jgi:(p)ppGpp synthase/HD superfamily hydrolase
MEVYIMVYTPLTNAAMKIAYQAHHGQLDYNGIPYIYHPLHLAEQMEDEISCCVALLHDVVEDTDITMDQLRDKFPPAVIDALMLLTHDDNTDYFDYVRSIKKNPIAKKVKLADLNHDSDQTRCVGSNITPEKLDKWNDKYTKARRILLDDAF